MKTLSRRRALFALGFSAAVGALLFTSVVAFAGSSDVAAPVRATDVLTSFNRARTADDSVPASAMAVLKSLLASGAPSEALNPGTPLPADSRKTISANGQTTYLVPTDKGQACFVVSPSGDAGCTDGSALARDGIEWGLVDPDGFDTGQPTVVRGLVGKTVEGVSVASDAAPQQVALDDGAFYVELASKPTTITLRLAGGSERKVTVPAPPAP